MWLANDKLARFHVETDGRQLHLRHWGSTRRPDAWDSQNVALEVGRWLGLAPIAFDFQWGRRDEQPTLTLVAGSLFAAIALSIAQGNARGRPSSPVL